MSENNKHTYAYIFIFLICLLSRILFKLISDYDNFELFLDSTRYDMLSDRILSGNFDLDIVAFITAPLYPYFLAFCKLLSPDNWQLLAVNCQFLLVSLSSVYIYKIAYLLFKSSGTSIIAAAIYIGYPLTMWYNFTLTQETFFQSFFILFSFYFLMLLKHSNYKNIFAASSFLALSFLTKSHITILIPLLAIMLFYKIGIKKTIVFILIVFMYTIPHGLVNYKIHNVFTFSSYGSNSLLLAGHSDETYPCLISTTKIFPKHQKAICNLDVIFHKPYKLDSFGNINGLPIIERNKMWRKAAFYWMKNNPDKTLKLKANGLIRFMLPGVDYYIYNFKTWILVFISGLLIYIPAYLVLYKKLTKSFSQHYYILSLILTIAIIFLLFYPQQRFRLITLEPMLIVYASVFYWGVIKSRWFNKKDAPL